MTVFLKADFLSDAKEYFAAVPELATRAAVIALNEVATRSGITKIKRDMNSQVAFPSGYLDSPNRLQVSRKATANRLEAVITGRDRPTSLARFASGQTPENSRGKKLVVRVQRGNATVLKKAFLVRLKNGNIGLAVRLKPGETPRNTTKAVQLDGNVYLLYGPSVDQVFKTILEAEAPMLLDIASKEFLRQFARLSRGT